MKRRVLEIAFAARNKTEQGQQKMKTAYSKLLETTSRVVGQAQKFSREIAGKVQQGSEAVLPKAKQQLQKAKQQLDEMIPRVKQVMKQARARVLGGDTRSENKLLSMFEPDTEVIRKGKASKPTEFGKMVKIQEAENQIVTHYEVFDVRPSDSDLLTPSLEKHRELFGRAPDLATAWRVLSGAFASPAGDVGSFATTNSYTLLLLVVFLAWHSFDTHGRLRLLVKNASAPLLWPAAALVWILAAAVSSGGTAKFVYFDF